MEALLVLQSPPFSGLQPVLEIAKQQVGVKDSNGANDAHGA
jgi:hypothetical protein